MIAYKTESKNILFLESYLDAREKAKKAENTSALSTNESSLEESYYQNIQKSTKQMKKNKINKDQQVVKSLWSPNSSDIVCKL